MSFFRSTPRFVGGPITFLVTRLMILQFIILALWQYRSIKIAREVLGSMKRVMVDFLGGMQIGRLLFAGGKFYYNQHIPGFPSRTLVRNQLGELHRIRPLRARHNRLRILFMNITNQCPFHCKHCFERENINKPDPLDTADYLRILANFTPGGIGQVHFSGGEPLLKYKRLAEVTRFLKGKSEVWIATTGLGLSLEKARALKKDGLTGASISVDHFEEALHNEFRGNPEAFKWAMEATRNSVKAGLLTGWALCATREFLTMENLYRYAELAASLGVHFIQLLEPIPVGAFQGQDVMLDNVRKGILEEFYMKYNSDKSLNGKPLITYHGYYIRRLGCMGNGNRYIAIDTSGNLQSCPFCRNDHKISALADGAEAIIERLQKEECLLDKF
jgi:MoaA/NifB/PqqE/SkfB family radical SAM enzyme